MLRMEKHLSADAIASFRLAARQAASAAEAVQARLHPIVCFLPYKYPVFALQSCHAAQLVSFLEN